MNNKQRAEIEAKARLNLRPTISLGDTVAIPVIENDPAAQTLVGRRLLDNITIRQSFQDFLFNKKSKTK